MTAPTRSTTAGRAYLELRKKARHDRRPVDELMQHYVLGYPLSLVHAEKIVTALSRGAKSTRWRDFADICQLARRHSVDGAGQDL